MGQKVADTAGDRLVVAKSDHVLHVIDIADPADPTLVSSMEFGGPATIRDIVAEGRYAYLLMMDVGLKIVDLRCETP